MRERFIISDTHWHHWNILNFKRADGSPLRSFSCGEDMDEHMIQKWNSVVRPEDKVYHCGDVMFRRTEILARLMGTKVLIAGNHDKFKLNFYHKYFTEIHGAHHVYDLLLTHVPIHPVSLGRFRLNVHGHLHYKHVMKLGKEESENPANYDERYFNASVECINYTPLNFSELGVRL